MLNRLYNCSNSRKCGLIHACETCANSYQKKLFYLHIKELDFEKINSFYYVVIGSKTILTLRENLEEIKEFMRNFSKRKSRKKSIYKDMDFFSRMEVSFKSGLGFYPHLNYLFFNVEQLKLQEELYQICEPLGLKFRVFKKENNENTIKSMLWYILKYNKMEWKRSVAVQVATKGVQEVRYSKIFSYTNLNNFDEDILPIIDMSFLKICPIRSGKEVAIRKEMSEKKREITNNYTKKLKKLKRCKCGCGLVLDTRRKFFNRDCMIRYRIETAKK